MLKLNTSPRRITIDTNPDQCNLKCIMCDTHSIYNKNLKRGRLRMPKELLETLLHQAIESGVQEIIPSTMGEPLMYPYFKETFVEILTNSPTTKLNLTTNGTFPKYGVEKWGEMLLPITSDTKISLNGISPTNNEKIMIGVCTENSIENIKNYLKIRDSVRKSYAVHIPTVTLQVTFMRDSLQGIEEVIKFAIDYNVDRVKGHHLWVTHPELKHNDLRTPENEGLWDNFIEKIEPYKKQIKLEGFVKLAQENLQDPDGYECPFLGKELWIDHTGKYNVCCAPSNLREYLGNFESVHNLPINDFFQQSSYIELIHNYKNKNPCDNCLLRKSVE